MKLDFVKTQKSRRVDAVQDKETNPFKTESQKAYGNSNSKQQLHQWTYTFWIKHTYIAYNIGEYIYTIEAVFLELTVSLLTSGLTTTNLTKLGNLNV